MLETFRKIAVAEGISYLAIFAISMPLKYIAGIGWPNKAIGIIHGILFVAYIFYAFLIKEERKWNLKELAIVLLCSVIPFGTFWMEKRYLKSS